MTTATQLLPLESGDHLTRDEFHRRYCAHPEIKRAELVEGVVYVASPVRLDQHGEPHSIMVMWLAAYRIRHGELRVGDNSTVILDANNELQPDAFLLRSRAQSADGYVAGAPELVVEVAASSASYDLYEKKHVYERNGVREYIVWQTTENRLDWFRLEDGQFREVAPDAAGIIRSSVFPGLRLNVAALLDGDYAKLLLDT